jgi:hypothetical protein
LPEALILSITGVDEYILRQVKTHDALGDFDKAIDMFRKTFNNGNYSVNLENE